MGRYTSFSVLLIYLFLSVTQIPLYSQNNVTISGLITDNQTGDPLIGTNILLYRDTISTDIPPLRGTSSNRFGFYAIPNLSKGVYYLIFRNLGYTTQVEKANVTIKEGTLSLSVSLVPTNIELSEVIISEESAKDVGLSTIDVSPQLLKMLPSFSGEMDIFRSLQLLPGVKTANEMSNGLYVRGGSPDQTLTLVDGTIIYNPAHLGNIASTFNSSAVHDVRLIKGAFPAEYGGRLSSVLDIKLRGGTKEKEKGKIGIGSLLSFATIEGPLSDSTTYMISTRIMYYDFFQDKFDSKSLIPRYNFIDLNSKINHNFDENTILTLSANFNKDNVYSPPSNEDFNYDILWDNTTISLNWLKVTSKSLFINLNASYINYAFKSALDNVVTDTLANDYFSSSNLKDFYFKSNLEYNWHQDHKFKTGLELGVHSYTLLNRDFYDPVLEISPDYEENIIATEGSFFVQDQWNILPTLNTNIGLRSTYFNDSKTFKIEPRISMAFSLTDNLILKSAYAIANQFLHLIIRNDITLPTDLWFPSTKEILPSNSEQVVFGFDTYIDEKVYLFSVESYYRTMKNIYEFKNVQEYSQDIPIESNFTKGEGEAYGVELFVNKRSGNLTGWIGYTLSWSRRLFNELNASKIFNPRYDRRHDVSIVLGYKISDDLSFGLTWTYATGQGFTMPNGQYLFSPPGISDKREERIQFNYTKRNNHKLPDYHKLDISSTYKFDLSGFDAEAFISIQNVYNRKNAFAQYVAYDNPQNSGIPKLKQITLMPFIPTAGISVKF